MLMKKRAAKTNAMRELEDAGIEYTVYFFEAAGKAPSGVEAAAKFGVPTNEVFKTLVTKGKSGEHHVFVIPSDRELDLKKAAHAAGEKSVEMIPQKDLVVRTGYVHGGCSPLAMKKRFSTVLDASAEGMPSFLVSAGRIGTSVRVSPAKLADHLGASFADVSVAR